MTWSEALVAVVTIIALAAVIIAIVRE